MRTFGCAWIFAAYRAFHTLFTCFRRRCTSLHKPCRPIQATSPRTHLQLFRRLERAGEEQASDNFVCFRGVVCPNLVLLRLCIA